MCCNSECFSVHPESLNESRDMDRILVVEDDPGIALGLEEDLTLEGYEVEVASNGELALRRAREKTFDLILLDVMLPDMDGYSVCRALRQVNTMVAIVFVTVAGDLKDCAKGWEAGCDSYLVKPIARTALSSAVRLFTSIARAKHA